MNQTHIVSKISEFLHIATADLAKWLGKYLPLVGDNWWSECVLNNLSYSQRERVESNNIEFLDRLDLAALLRVADKSWYDLRNFLYLPQSQRECIRAMFSVRNNWAHCAMSIPGKDAIIEDLSVIEKFMLQTEPSHAQEVRAFAEEVRIKWDTEKKATAPAVPHSNVFPINNAPDIQEKSIVALVSDRTKSGPVLSVYEENGVRRYDVYIDNAIKQFFDGQVVLAEASTKNHFADITTLRNSLTSYQILNPSTSSLYSLNAARIDFVPYQFRPALKMIKSDTPRILIADSVGVGKTIEAGLILKELQARTSVDSVLIVCPKPLVAERKWQLEMKRFDEEFTQLNGAALRRCISDTDRDGVWPARENKTIIPYSLLSSEELLYGAKADGKKSKKGNLIGLLDLDPPPHFDLIIVDEAHHIRNNNTQAYKAVKFLCDHATAVVFLTATPIQTSDEDLFTLLNVLRPDVILDTETFRMMSRPNQYISQAVRAIRMGGNDWQNEALKKLNEIPFTQWGQSVISHNPKFEQAKEMLSEHNLSRDNKVELVSLIEELHSFSNMLNRTRRSDIQDFCIRRSHTIECDFTSNQQLLHDELLRFEALALTAMHGSINVKFMMSMIRRQAASCVFGLAPFIRSIINRRLSQIWEDPEVDINDRRLDDENIISTIKMLSESILQLADHLPDDDPKFDGAMFAIRNKQRDENNKIIIFSTFKHTLAYLKSKLNKTNMRVAQIDGSVKDDDRVDLRARFELNKANPNALDILLFTEVGCEGLDYQFCDMMINYDLPWNPMRIEQRIGRIDRRGQKSEAVNIFNMITSGTVDAEIYHRCLERIGVFENSIGECSEILGQISKEIENIAMNSELNDGERSRKLEQMADNEIRKIQELGHLEQEEKELFGFDLTSMSMAREVRDAENPWLSARSIQHMVESYLTDRIGGGTYLTGEKEQKYLRLSVDARKKLLEDLRSLKLPNSPIKRELEKYLKGTEPGENITFDAECAEKNRNVMFVTSIHPLAKMAAMHFNMDIPLNVSVYVNSMDYTSGVHPFLIYSWDYTGHKPERKPIAVCKDKYVQEDLFELLQIAITDLTDLEPYESAWRDLETIHFSMWESEKARYVEDVSAVSRYKTESLLNSWKNRKRALKIKISDATEPNILRMYNAELENAERMYNEKMEELKLSAEKADIHTVRLVCGVIVVKNIS